MEPDYRQIIISLVAQGRLTGDIDSLDFDGEDLIRPPVVELTSWGGRTMPELNEIRPKHQSLVYAVNEVCIANGSSFRAEPIPEFHIINDALDGDHRYAEKLASPEHSDEVQNAYAKALTLHNFLGIPIWSTFIPGVGNHALWHTDADEEDAIARYEFEIRKWQKWLGRNSG